MLEELEVDWLQNLRVACLQETGVSIPFNRNPPTTP